MSRRVFVHQLPSLFEPSELKGGSAVVIDVLRASTTIVHALAAGARAVVPCLDVPDAKRRAGQGAPGETVLAGERGGVLIDGFDLDNSPLRHTPDKVRDRTVVFTTTNGTGALLACSSASRVFVGAFVNLGALTRRLHECSGPVHLVCAGTRGRPTADDVLCAGAIVSRLAGMEGFDSSVDDQAQIAREFFAAHSGSRSRLVAALRSARGGRDLVALGFDEDIERAAELDLYDLVPEYSARTGRIEPAGGPAGGGVLRCPGNGSVREIP